jgi:glutamate-1-semialdehyde 2,1-aminomutase
MAAVQSIATTQPLDTALAQAIASYRDANPESFKIFTAATGSMPGGNTRSVLFYEPFPLCMVRGEGCRLTDADGHDYVDLLGEYTAGLYGHSNPIIREAVEEALKGGLSLSGHNRMEARLAELICTRFPSIELVRFTNSGTEANLMALAAAKVFTARRKILVFAGGYHGGVLSFANGSAPVNVPHEFIIAPYNDMEATQAALASASDDLAAILIEPMQGGGGCIPADAAFLQMLRDEATRRKAVLIFDEVMTSRLSPGGRQQMLDIIPDMTTLGKYLGGGMTFGAFGGRADIMSLFDPRRSDALAHAGTFNNNILTMTAGVAGLTRIFTPEACVALNERGERLRARLNDAFAQVQARLKATGIGSMMTIHPQADAATAAKLRELLFFDLIARGYYLARRGMIALALPLGEAEMDGFINAVGDILNERRSLYAAGMPD